MVKSGPYIDILSFDRELTEPEESILQELIDVSYGQFVSTVATARHLDEAAVRGFADGRIFTGAQALELGVVDRLGTEADARRWAAELADFAPDKTEVYTIEERKPFWNKLLPGNQSSLAWMSPRMLGWVEFELAHQGIPLWLYQSPGTTLPGPFGG